MRHHSKGIKRKIKIEKKKALSKQQTELSIMNYDFPILWKIGNAIILVATMPFSL